MVVTTRPIEAADRAFLLRVYASTRTDIAALEWDDRRKAALYENQFTAQHVDYHNRFGTGRFNIVLANGQPVGRVYVNDGEAEHRIIDIAVLPEFQRRGIASTIMTEILKQADHQGKPVRLRVAPTSPARTWYERLGFKLIADETVNWHMERPSPGKP